VKDGGDGKLPAGEDQWVHTRLLEIGERDEEDYTLQPPPDLPQNQNTILGEGRLGIEDLYEFLTQNCGELTLTFSVSR